MPEYQFFCEKCGNVFTIHSSMEKYDESKVTCKICGNKHPTRKYTSFGLLFNGDGFYCTDNKKE